MADSPISEIRHLLTEQGILLWRRKFLALAICWGVCIVGWTVVMLLPRSYESDARVFVDVNGLLTPLLKGMVIQTVPGQDEDYLRQTLLSRPNLEKVAVLANLNQRDMSRSDKEALTDKLAAEASIKEDGHDLVGISFDGKSPTEARNVMVALLSIFAEAASSSSRVEMEKASKFLDDQIAQYGAHLRASEERLAEFRRKYENVLPDPTSGAPRVQVLTQQVQQDQDDYDRAVLTRDSLAAQVKAAPQLLSVNVPPVVGPDGKLVAATPELRLEQAKRTVSELKLQYTDEYPDVLAAERDVKELEDQVRSGSADGKTQISNPVYEQIRLKLVDAETAVPAAKQKLDEATTQLNYVKSMADQIPEIEARGKDIDRDYAVVKANYDELVKRREAASLSQAADDQADRTQFRIVDPPSLPLAPSFPNFPVMISLVLLIGVGAGVAIPLGMAYLRPTFSSMARLRELGLPVIGSVTLIPRPASGPMALDSPVILYGSFGALIVLYGIAIALGTMGVSW